MARSTLLQGDSREVLKTLAESSVDSIVTDPPYELGFMGKSWDGTGVANDSVLWREALRVAKPGAWLLAFGGTRTFHRMACAIEDAGWELRDTPLRGHTPQPEDCPWLMGWMYGSGFPKSRNGEWGGTALKPAWEPIVCARKPLIGTVEANWRKHGTGGLNIDACRIGWPDGLAPEIGTAAWGGPAKMSSAVPGQTGETVERLPPSPLGRWPANLIHDGSAEVLASFPQTTSGAMKAGTVRAAQDEPGSVCYGTFGGNATDEDTPGDSGSAARFFYCAKAGREDRNEGCEHFERKPLNWSSGTKNPGSFQAEGTDRTSPNRHPTVKPTDLMAYLCRLVTPAGGLVLDPFMGSGSTGKAAMLEGFNFIGIDLSAEYVEIARARIDFALRQGHQPSLLETA